MVAGPEVGEGVGAAPTAAENDVRVIDPGAKEGKMKGSRDGLDSAADTYAIRASSVPGVKSITTEAVI
jgi:hypothetical protein